MNYVTKTLLAVVRDCETPREYNSKPNLHDCSLIIVRITALVREFLFGVRKCLTCVSRVEISILLSTI